MADDDPFEPRLGRIRSQKLKVPKSFRARILHATQRSGGFGRTSGAENAASRRGRGGGVARVIASGRGRSGYRRRVIIKARYIKLAGKGITTAAAHLKYIQRDGVTRDGAPGQMYGAESDRADAKSFMERSAGDKVQFRFILAPEDADQYPDLKPFTRKLMTQMDQDLGTRLDWVAVDHFNTGHPHTHIVVRGCDEHGRDLIIAREYISQGLRDRAETLVELDLGPPSDLEIAARQSREIDQARLTSIDRTLLRDADALGQLVSGSRHPQIQALRAGRLKKLQDFGLADEIAPGRWQLRPDMEPTLRRMGERGDIIKTLHYELTQKGMTHAIPDSRIHDLDPVDRQQPRAIVGQVLKRGVMDDGVDRHFLLVDGVDGRVHFVDIGEGHRTEALGEHAIVRVNLKVPEVRAADRAIAEVAAANSGYYNVEAHLAFDSTATQTFAETHVRRLEAIRRGTSAVERDASGRFQIGSDYLETALAFEQRQARRAPAQIDQLSSLLVKNQARWQGLTWLDHELNGPGEAVADAGFGREVKTALQARRLWLVEQGLAEQIGETSFHLKAGFTDTLRRQELQSAAGEITRSTGLAYSEAHNGARVEGILRQSISLGAGKYAVVERARDFSLVPWRSALDDHMGKTIAGIVREGGINWSIGRTRGPQIE